MLATILRQPMLHFFVIGLALFGLFSLVDDTPVAPPADVITVSTQDAAWLAEQFQATWQRPPTPDELEEMIDDFVAEEIYVREALSLGLDQGDTIVRRRLRQKMEFLTEAGAEAASPDDATLRQHFQENADRFETPARIAFTQILLPDDQPEAAEAILAALDDGAAPETLGAPTLLPQALPASPASAVDGTFGAGVFDQLSTLAPDTWSGPITSGYGRHIVRLDSHAPASLPRFETVRDAVEIDWRAGMADRLRRDRFEALAAQYRVDRPDPVQVRAR